MLRFVRGVGYIWRDVSGVVGGVRVGEWRLGAGSRRAGTEFARADPSHSTHSATLRVQGGIMNFLLLFMIRPDIISSADAEVFTIDLQKFRQMRGG